MEDVFLKTGPQNIVCCMYPSRQEFETTRIASKPRMTKKTAPDLTLRQAKCYFLSTKPPPKRS